MGNGSRYTSGANGAETGFVRHDFAGDETHAEQGAPGETMFETDDAGALRVNTGQS